MRRKGVAEAGKEAEAHQSRQGQAGRQGKARADRKTGRGTQGQVRKEACRLGKAGMQLESGKGRDR
jgi:hypothetical protein